MWGDLSRKEQVLYGLVGALVLFSVTSWGRSLMSQPAKLEVHEPTPQPPGLNSEEAQGLLGMPPAEAAKESEIVVHVVGAVASPKVIRVPPNSRVQDAIRLCGGPTSEADLTGINLAAVLVDGTQLRVPKKTKEGSLELEGDDPYSPAAAKATYASEQPKNEASVATGGKVSLNTGTKADLESLPGVGPATAQKILDYRRQSGGFTSIEEVMNVKGIGPKKYEAMKAMLKL